MLLMVGKITSGKIYHTIHYYAKTNIKYMEDCDKSKEFSYLNYWEINNLCGYAMSQKLPLDGF